MRILMVLVLTCVTACGGSSFSSSQAADPPDSGSSGDDSSCCSDAAGHHDTNSDPPETSTAPDAGCTGCGDAAMASETGTSPESSTPPGDAAGDEPDAASANCFSGGSTDPCLGQGWKYNCTTSAPPKQFPASMACGTSVLPPESGKWCCAPFAYHSGGLHSCVPDLMGCNINAQEGFGFLCSGSEFPGADDPNFTTCGNTGTTSQGGTYVCCSNFN